MKDLTKGNIFKTFFLFGAPLVLAGILTSAYSIINSAIAGQFLGEVGLATTSATSPLESFINSAFSGFCVGFSMYIARLFANKEYGKLKSAFYTCLLLISLLGFIFGGTMILLYEPLADLLKIDARIRTDSFRYFSIINGGRGIIVISTLLVFALNAMGVSGCTFWLSLLSSVLNVAGNVLSIILLDMGVVGIALSTVLSSLIVNILYLLKIRSCFKQLDNDGKRVCLKFLYVKKSIPYALPNMVQQMVMYLVGLLISPLVNGMGVAVTASYSVVMHIYNLIAWVYQNLSRTVSNYTAQCAGSKQYAKIKKGVGIGLLQGLVFTTPFILVCVVFREAVCGIFLKPDASALTKEYSYIFAKIYLPFIYFNIVNNLFHALYRGVKAMGHLFFVTLLGSFTRLLCSWFLIPKMGMEGFFLGWVISWVVEAIVTTGLYFIGKWRPKAESLPQEQTAEQEKAA